MPLPPLSRREARLGRFAAGCSALYATLAVLFAAFPGAVFRIAGLGAHAELGPEVRFWQVLGASSMAAISVACAVAASSPRERRVALLPVLAGNLSTSALALLAFAAAPAGALASSWRSLASLVAVDFPLFLVTMALYRHAAPGVHLSSTPTQQAPEVAESEVEVPKVRLTVGGRPS
jgi:hypothetical protein